MAELEIIELPEHVKHAQRLLDDGQRLLSSGNVRQALGTVLDAVALLTRSRSTPSADRVDG